MQERASTWAEVEWKKAEVAVGESADLLLEIGTEEIPPGYISPALQQLGDVASDGLAG